VLLVVQAEYSSAASFLMRAIPILGNFHFGNLTPIIIDPRNTSSVWSSMLTQAALHSGHSIVTSPFLTDGISLSRVDVQNGHGE
jgi:hypothetical protein